MLKSVFKISAIALVLFSGLSQAASEKTIRLGIVSGEDENVLAVAAQEAKKDGLDIKLIKFNDYV